uniref:Uncharacterized protein n=1 Tax=Romanomermis culicivorax TaxID=13658 RepID=A0A915HZW0_ROMCU
MEAREQAVFATQPVAAGVRVGLHLAVPHVAAITIAKIQPKIEHRADNVVVHLSHELLSRLSECEAVRHLCRPVVENFGAAQLEEGWKQLWAALTVDAQINDGGMSLVYALFLFR